MRPCWRPCPHPRAYNLEGVYVGLGAGVSLLLSERASRLISPKGAIAIDPARSSFETGARVSASIGYGFGNGFRPELEGTALGAGRVRARGAANVPATLGNGRTSAYEASCGGFLNGYYEFDLSGAALPLDVNPYRGVGAGYLRSRQKDLVRLAPGTTFTSVSADRNSLGVQGVAGLALPFAAVPGLTITAEYRATARSGGQYDARFSGGRGPARTIRLEDDATVSHSVMLGVRYAF